MGILGVRLRAELRINWRLVLGLVLLVGAAAGLAIGALAGARRTASVVDRFRTASKVYDVNLNPIAEAPLAAWAKVLQLPQITRATHLVGVVGAPELADGTLDSRWLAQGGAATDDPGYGRDFDRPTLVEGHMPSTPNEAVLNEQSARLVGASVGDRFTMRWFDVPALESGVLTPDMGTAGEMTISGVIKGFDDALKDPDDSTLIPFAFFGSGALQPGFTPPYELYAFRLRHGGADVDEFVTAARALVGDTFVVQDSAAASDRANRSFRPYVVALSVFGLLVFITGIGLAVQAFARSERRHAGDDDTLRAMGLTRRQLLDLAMLRALVIGSGGGVLALLIAILLSPLTPLGDARSIEPDPGVHADPIFIVGFAVIVVLFALVAASLVGLAARRRSTQRVTVRPSGFRSRRANSPVTALGLSLAIGRPADRDGPPPARSLSGLAVVLVIMIGAVVYGANLVRFATTPTRYGAPWDAMISADRPPEQITALLATMPEIGSVATGGFGQVSVVDGPTVPAVALGHGEPGGSIEIIDGRAPSTADEIVFGRRTMKDLGLRIGSTVGAVTQSGEAHTFTVVGQGVFARFAPYPSSEPTGLGVGAAITLDALVALGQSQLASPFLLVTAAPGHTIDRTALAAALGSGSANQEQAGRVFARQRPVDVRGYVQMRAMPLALVLVLGVLMLGAFVHLLTTGSRHRRRDLAVVRAMGFTNSQVRRTVLVQALVMLGLVALVATPIGVVTGGWAWRLTARWLGVADDTSLALVPVGLLLAAVTGAVGLIAILSGRLSTRGPIGLDLVTE